MEVKAVIYIYIYCIDLRRKEKIDNIVADKNIKGALRTARYRRYWRKHFAR